MTVPVIPFSIRFWPGIWNWAEKITSSPARKAIGLAGQLDSV